MKRPLLLFLSLIAGTAFLAAQQPGFGESLADKKIDASKPMLPSMEGVTLWYEGRASHGCKIVRASADGTTVEISSTGQNFQAQWSKLPADAKAKLAVDYAAAVNAAAKEANDALAAQRQAEDEAAGIQTFTNWEVISNLEEGLLLGQKETVILLTGHPHQASFADDDLISFKARAHGVYKYRAFFGTVNTVHSFQYSGPAD